MTNHAINRVIVSVILPCYNRSDIVGRAINSLLLQTYSNIEVIVVDDGSDDGTDLLQIIASFTDERVRLIRHDVNKNGAAARNTGIAASSGEFIAFCDSDDEWYPEKLEKQLALVDFNPSTRTLIYCASHVITKDGDIERKSILPSKAIKHGQRVSDYLFLRGGFIPTPSMVVPTWLARQICFNETLGRHQDYDFLLRLDSNGCEFRMHPDPLLCVHWEDMRITQRGLDISGSLKFIEEYEQYVNENEKFGFIYQQIVLRLLQVGRRFEALSVLGQYGSLRYLRLSQVLTLLSLFTFGDIRMVSWVLEIKKLMQRTLSKSMNSEK